MSVLRSMAGLPGLARDSTSHRLGTIPLQLEQERQRGRGPGQLGSGCGLEQMGAPICVSPIPSDTGGSGEDTVSEDSESDPSGSMVDVNTIFFSTLWRIMLNCRWLRILKDLVVDLAIGTPPPNLWGAKLVACLVSGREELCSQRDFLTQ